MTNTNGDIRVEVGEGGRVILNLVGLPDGQMRVSIRADKWEALVTEVIHLRSLLRIKARVKVYTAADAAKAVETGE